MSLTFYLYLSAFLFCTGLSIAIVKRNIIAVLIGLELMLNAANLNFIAFSRMDAKPLGELFVVFIIVVAAAEAAVALAIALKVYEFFRSAALDKVSELKG
jgi:NADH:ubiquinone oxidoreductase subunit K